MTNKDRIKYVGYISYADNDVYDEPGSVISFLARDEFELHRTILSTNIEDVFAYDLIARRELTEKEIADLTFKDSFTEEECRYSDPYPDVW